MTQEKRFLKHFIGAVIFILLLLMGLVTWSDPFRNLNLPWRSSFVSDRNVAYRHLKLMQERSHLDDVVVGSSTCEIFQPQVLKDYFHTEAFNAGMPAATLPLRYLLVKAALQSHPELKRIIWVSDLFEFRKLTLPTKIYYQPELRSYLDHEDLARIEEPSFKDRFQDVFSYASVERSFATLGDMALNLVGKYHSRFFPDGGTEQSMVVVDATQPIEWLAKDWGANHRVLYSDMDQLHPNAVWMFRKMAKLVKDSPHAELHIVLTPVHRLYYESFRNKFEGEHLYADWIQNAKDLEKNSGGRIHVHDFSYPEYMKRGITQKSKFWLDGVHFSSASMLLIGQDIYR